MSWWWGFNDWRYYRRVEQVRKAVYAHYRNRGVPETRLNEMWYRWQKTKGMRKPIYQQEQP